MLIVFAGLPGVGKTTLAQEIVRQMRACYLRIDTIEQALRSPDRPHEDIGPSGYRVAQRVAEENLRLGSIVVADAVNASQEARDAWISVARRANAKIVIIELVCSNVEEHRRRVVLRTSDIDGLEPPTWQDVTERTYKPWTGSHLVLDTAYRSQRELLTDVYNAVHLSAEAERPSKPVE